MFSTDITSEDLAKRNLEKRENREQAKQVLETNSGTAMMASLAAEGGPMARRIAREIRRFESTGRVSSWLAGETIKAESKREVPSTAVDEFLTKGRAISTFFASPPQRLPFNGAPKFKPEIPMNSSTAPPPPCALGLYNKNGDVYISSGTIAGKLPPSFDPVDGKFIASSGSDSVYAEIDINEDTGTIDSVDVKRGSTPNNTSTSFYISIGAYEYETGGKLQISNFRCGSINITLCRNWFVASPPYFTANIS